MTLSSSGRTSEPVQNIGHLVHGSSLAFCSHVLKYGFLTINGRTGGVNVDALAMLASSIAGMTSCDRIVGTKHRRKCEGEHNRYGLHRSIELDVYGQTQSMFWELSGGRADAGLELGSWGSSHMRGLVAGSQSATCALHPLFKLRPMLRVS